MIYVEGSGHRPYLRAHWYLLDSRLPRVCSGGAFPPGMLDSTILTNCVLSGASGIGVKFSRCISGLATLRLRMNCLHLVLAHLLPLFAITKD